MVEMRTILDIGRTSKSGDPDALEFGNRVT